MRFNLKNRPETHGPYAGNAVDKWFEGFEKQEREKNKITAVKIEELGDAKQIPLEQLGFLRGYLQRGKEILGEKNGVPKNTDFRQIPARANQQSGSTGSAGCFRRKVL